MSNEAVRRYGVASREEIAGLSGREVLERIIDRRLPSPPISRQLTFDIVEVGEGTAAFEGETGEHLLNPAGSVHGGWALTLIDSAAGCAAYTLLPADVAYTTVETKANFSRPIMADSGRVRCEARVVSRGRQIISCEATIKNAEGKIVAHGTSTLMVLNGR
ncbi:MAG: PaaI family thioesterase [Pseudomonadota bacterium]|nr:PaaI family thioesterase [Pseudomonadota bacterium]